MKHLAYLVFFITIPLVSIADSATQRFDINAFRGDFLEFSLSQVIDALSQSDESLSAWGNDMSSLNDLRNNCERCIKNNANNEQCIVYQSACKNVEVTSVNLRKENNEQMVVIVLSDASAKFQYELSHIVNCSKKPFRGYCKAK